MEMSGIPFGTTDWSQIEPTEHKGEKGRAYWRTRQFGASFEAHAAAVAAAGVRNH